MTAPRRLPFIGQMADLPKSLQVLFAVRLINVTGNFVFPYMTLLLTSKLNYSKDAAGIFLSCALCAAVPSSLLGGKVADRFGRLPVIVTFSLLKIACLLPCAFLKDLTLVPWLMAGSAFAMGAVDPSYTALVGDLTHASERRRAFSLLYLGTNLGAAIGPLIAGFLFERHTALLFAGNSLAIALGLLLVWWHRDRLSPDQTDAPHPASIPAQEAPVDGSLMKVLALRPHLLVFMVFQFFFSFALSQWSFSLPLQLKEQFGVSGASAYGLLMTVNALTVIFFTSRVLSLTHGLTVHSCMMLSGVLFATGFGVITFIHATWLFVLSTYVWTLGEILLATSAQTYVTNHAPMTHRGRINSLHLLISGAGTGLSPLAMGIFVQRFGIRPAWPLISLVSLIGTAGMFFLSRRQPESAGWQSESASWKEATRSPAEDP